MSETKKHRASSRPLIPGGNNYTAMHLVFREQSVRVKPSLWCYFFAGLLILPGALFLIVPVLMFQLFHDAEFLKFKFLFFTTAFIVVFSGIFIYLAVRMVWNLRKRCRSFFDLSTQIFYPQGYDAHESDPEKFPAIPFSKLNSLQIVEEHCPGKNSFDSYELNVVLCDGSRFNLLDHSNKECFAEEAEKLSGILSLPLTDAQGRRLSCDSFLSLPSNIRENLLYGLYGFLLFLLLFAFGDGRAWYLTHQSFHWKKIPAVVESAKIHKNSGRRTTYSLDFQFRYRYQGKIFTGTDYNFFDMRTSEYAVEEIIQRYPRGRKISCYVNPRSPKLAVVDRHIPSVWEMLLNSPWSSSFLIMGIFCLLKAATQYRLLKKRGGKQ